MIIELLKDWKMPSRDKTFEKGQKLQVLNNLGEKLIADKVAKKATFTKKELKVNEFSGNQIRETKKD